MNYKQGKLAIEKTIDKTIEALERGIISDFTLKQREVLNIVQKYYANFLVDVPKADYYTTLSLYNRLQTLEKEIKSVYIKLNSNVYKATYAGQEQIFNEAYLRNEYLTSYFTSGVKFKAPNPLIREVSITGDVELIKTIKNKKLKTEGVSYISKSGSTLSSLIRTNNEQSLTKIYRNLKQGLINGASYQKQAIAIKDEFGKNASKALRVARTEGNRNANAGALENTNDIREQGISIKRQWLATLDSNTRDTHARLDGQLEDKDGLFWIGSDSAKYPSDFANVAESVNCRCTTIDIVEGVSPTLRRGIDPLTGKSDIMSFKNYDEWAKQKA